MLEMKRLQMKSAKMTRLESAKSPFKRAIGRSPKEAEFLPNKHTVRLYSTDPSREKLILHSPDHTLHSSN